MAFPKQCWTTKKEKSLKQLTTTLDRWFSAYIRLRDADIYGMCRCITCNSLHHWKEMDCGHFITRNHIAVRWDEKNCNSQCTACNNYGKGEQFKHGLAIDRKYGAGTAEMLKDIGSVRVKLDRLWFESMIAQYKAMAKDLMKEKGL